MLDGPSCGNRNYQEDDSPFVFDSSEWLEDRAPDPLGHLDEWLPSDDEAPATHNSRAAEFAAYASAWEEETAHLSSINAMAMNLHYQRIIGMGAEAIPLILTRLQHIPGHWFWALNAITGENPIPESSAGNLPLMTEAWLEWGRSHGYI